MTCKDCFYKKVCRHIEVEIPDEVCRHFVRADDVEKLEVENKALRGAANSYKLHCENIKADTVREMQTRLSMHFGTYTEDTTVKVCDLFKVTGEVAEKILNETEDDLT